MRAGQMPCAAHVAHVGCAASPGACGLFDRPRFATTRVRLLVRTGVGRARTHTASGAVLALSERVQRTCVGQLVESQGQVLLARCTHHRSGRDSRTDPVSC